MARAYSRADERRLRAGGKPARRARENTSAVPAKHLRPVRSCIMSRLRTRIPALGLAAADATRSSDRGRHDGQPQLSSGPAIWAMPTLTERKIACGRGAIGPACAEP